MATCTDFTISCITSHSAGGETVKYLSLLLGNWVDFYFGSGDSTAGITMTPLMVGIGCLNFVALLYSSVLTLFNASNLGLNAAATGHFWGRFSPMLPLRVFIGFATLAPAVTILNQSSYVSTGQLSATYVISRAAGMADWVVHNIAKAFVEEAGASRAGRVTKEAFANGPTVTQMMYCTAWREAAGTSKRTFEARAWVANMQPLNSGSSNPNTAGVSDLIEHASKGTSVSYDGVLGGDWLDRAYDKRLPFYTEFVSIAFSDGVCGEIKLGIANKIEESDINSVDQWYSEATLEDFAAYRANRLSNEAILRYLELMYKHIQEHVKQIMKADRVEYVVDLRKMAQEEERYKRIMESNGRNHQQIASNIYKLHVNLAHCLSTVGPKVFGGSYSWSGADQLRACANSAGSNGSSDDSQPSYDLVSTLTEGGWMFWGGGFSRMSGLYEVANQQAVFSSDNLKKYTAPTASEFCPKGALEAMTDAIINVANDSEETLAHSCAPYWTYRYLNKQVWDHVRLLSRKGELDLAISPSGNGTWWPSAKTGNDWTALLELSDTENQSDSGGSSGIDSTKRFAGSILQRVVWLGEDNGNVASRLGDPAGAQINGASNRLFDTSGNTNPITVLATLGEGLKQIYYVTIAAQSLAESVRDLGNKTTGGWGGFGFAFIGGYLTKLITPLVMGSLVGAFFLANILPLVPLVTFMFAVIAYFLTGIEAVAGITLGAALLMSASGDGLLAVHGLRMAAMYGAIFLRPTLHCIGFTLGFAMSFFSFAYFNRLWWSEIVTGAYHNLDVFNLALTIGGFAILAVYILLYNYKFTNLFTNNLMTWISSHVTGTFGDTSSYIDSTQGALGKMQGSFDGALKGASQKSNDPAPPAEAPDSSGDKGTNPNPNATSKKK